MGTRACTSCGRSIAFKRTSGGKWQPINLDGSAHYPTCNENRVKDFLATNDRPPVWPPKGVPGAKPADMKRPSMKVGKRIIGVHAGIICPCPKNIPPWEDCACVRT